MATRRNPESKRSFVGGDRAQQRDYGFNPGDQIGDWTVVGPSFVKPRPDGRGNQYFPCRCACGREVEVKAQSLEKGSSTQCVACSCRKASKISNARRSYEHICPDRTLRMKLLGRIHSAMQRCHREYHPSYRNYGARGIRVYEPWQQDRSKFLAYLLTLPGHDNLKFDMDRIDVNGHYEPGNLRFISKSENNSNKRKLSDLEAIITHLRKENADLTTRLRHYKCGAAQPLYSQE